MRTGCALVTTTLLLGRITVTDSEIERMASKYIAEDWEPDRYYRDMNLIAFARALLEHGYEDGYARAIKMVAEGE